VPPSLDLYIRAMENKEDILDALNGNMPNIKPIIKRLFKV
jgi:hypothetical protein